MTFLDNLFSKIINAGVNQSAGNEPRPVKSDMSKDAEETNMQKAEANVGPTREEIHQTKEYIHEAMDILARELSSGVEPSVVYLPFCGTDKECGIRYSHINGEPPGKLTMEIMVYYPGTDVICSQFDHEGTSEELYEYINMRSYDVNELYERFVDMSKQLYSVFNG